MLWVYIQYEYVTLPMRGSTSDVRFWRLKSIPALKEWNIYNGRLTPVNGDICLKPWDFARNQRIIFIDIQSQTCQYNRLVTNRCACDFRAFSDGENDVTEKAANVADNEVENGAKRKVEKKIIEIIPKPIVKEKPNVKPKSADKQSGKKPPTSAKAKKSKQAVAKPVQKGGKKSDVKVKPSKTKKDAEKTEVKDKNAEKNITEKSSEENVDEKSAEGNDDEKSEEENVAEKDDTGNETNEATESEDTAEETNGAQDPEEHEIITISTVSIANTGCRPNAGLMLVYRLRRWTNIKPAFGWVSVPCLPCRDCHKWNTFIWKTKKFHFEIQKKFIIKKYHRLNCLIFDELTSIDVLQLFNVGPISTSSYKYIISSPWY